MTRAGVSRERQARLTSLLMCILWNPQHAIVVEVVLLAVADMTEVKQVFRMRTFNPNNSLAISTL